jgi:EmrB/QacA subfamily drug resistance transporter
MRQATEAAPAPVSRKITLGITTLSSFLTAFMGSAITVALPAIGKEFALNAILLSWVSASYLLSAALFLIPFGRIADIYGRRSVFLWGIILFSAASLATGLAPFLPVLLLARVVQGIGGAMIMSTAMAILISVFPSAERGRALGINVAAVYVGLSVGPFLGGFLTRYLGWRSIFFTIVPLGILIGVLILLKLKGEWREAHGESFDYAGALALGFAFVSLMYGFTLLPTMAGAGLIAAGLAGFFVFYAIETKSRHPLLAVTLFRRNNVFIFSNLAALINYSATFAVSFLLSLYLQYVKGFLPQQAGIILVAQPAMQALFSPLAGKLSDRIEPRNVASLGMALTAGGLFFLIFLARDTPLAFIVADLLLLGIGFALFSSPNTNAVMSAVERKFYGVASGVLGAMRLTGQMLSMGITMLLFALFLGNAPITAQNSPQFLSSLKAAFLAFTVLCICGIFASLARGTMHEGK